MTDAPVQGPVQATVSICNQRGLHARASAKFVKLASSFESEIRVTRDGVTVDARSIMGLLMLGAGIGCGRRARCSVPQSLRQAREVLIVDRAPLAAACR